MVLLLQNAETKVLKKGITLQCLRSFTLNCEAKVPRYNVLTAVDFFGMTNARTYAKGENVVLCGKTPLLFPIVFQLTRHRGKKNERKSETDKRE